MTVGGSPVYSGSMSRITIDDLQDDPRNPRRIDDRAAEGLRASLEHFGDLSGLTWNRQTGELVAGHQRLAALRAAATSRGVELRVDDAPGAEAVVLPAAGDWPEERFRLRVVDWDDDTQIAANIAANNPAIAGAFTADLQHLLDEVAESSPDLFHAVRFDELTRVAREALTSTGTEAPEPESPGEEVEPPEPRVDRAAELQVQWQTAPGQIWEIPSKTVPGRCHRVACGDSTDPKVYRAACGDETPWMMVTDPPYGVEYDPDWRNHAKRADGSVLGASSLGAVENDHRAGWEEAYRLFGGDVAYVWHAGLYGPAVLKDLEACGFIVRAQIVWVKSHFAIGRGDYHWQHEPAWYVVRRGKVASRTDDRSQSTTWNIAKPGSGSGDNEATGHGTQKPVECMARPIRNHDFPDARAVYDPFLGSGTTIVAAERLGKIAVGCELSPAYVAVILQRLADMGLEPRRIS